MSAQRRGCRGFRECDSRLIERAGGFEYSVAVIHEEDGCCSAPGRGLIIDSWVFSGRGHCHRRHSAGDCIVCPALEFITKGVGESRGRSAANAAAAIKVLESLVIGGPQGVDACQWACPHLRPNISSFERPLPNRFDSHDVRRPDSRQLFPHFFFPRPTRLARRTSQRLSGISNARPSTMVRVAGRIIRGQRER